MSVDTSTEAVAALLDGVTPGPWSLSGVRYHNLGGDWQNLMAGEQHIASVGIDPRDLAGFADGKFLAAARELVPALAADRDALAARVAVLEAALREMLLLGDNSTAKHGRIARDMARAALAPKEGE